MTTETEPSMDNVRRSFAELLPTLQEVSRLVRSAPLQRGEIIGLSLMVAAHFTGDVAGAMDKHPSECAREIALGIADLVAKRTN